MPAQPLLPIDAVLPEILAALRPSPAVVLQAPPGAGKTTRVPPAMLDAGLVGTQQLWVLQPRRVAARATARRIAEERGVRLGEDVGYQIRMERQASAATRMLVVTEGVLTRRLLSDPFLEGIGGIVLDEFHERHLETDLTLAMLRRVQQTVRPDLKLIVMSATLTTETVSDYLEQAPIITCNVPTFPIEIRYQAKLTQQPLAIQMADAAASLLSSTAGDLLAFFPGVGEIQRTLQELRCRAELKDCLLLPLYGDLSAADQDRVFQPSPQRKIVLATNVAETSITIPGITAVIDSGLARIPEFDPANGLNRLVLKPISQAAGDQRAGRAGRTGPGVCLRLWTAAAQRSRPAFERPEIQRMDLAGIVLSLQAWGEHDLTQFPWFEPPRPQAIAQAVALLQQLGLMNAEGITPRGEQVQSLPLHPRLGVLLLTGQEFGQLEPIALAAALLSERDPFVREDRFQSQQSSRWSDMADRVEALLRFAEQGDTECHGLSLQRDAAKQILRVADKLQRLCPARASPPKKSSRSLTEVLSRALLAAFPDRLVKRRGLRSRQGIMVGGRGVRLAETSGVLEPDYFLAVDIDDTGSEARVRLAAGIEREWLPATQIATETVVEFDTTNFRVQARQRTSWLGLTLEESPTALPDDARVDEALMTAAVAHWDRACPADDPALQQFLARVECLREWCPELELPLWDIGQLQALLPEVVRGCRALADLNAGRWLSVLQSQLESQQLVSVDREAPERISVPSGSRIALQYAIGQPPVLAARIQELFGWMETPRIARGRVKLLLHLLAPNSRPQQITDDLRSFWSSAYQVVRGELRRRYPKHAWPEDPWTAVAQRKPGSPRKR